MLPIIYKANETNFSHNGLGVLRDCTSCRVFEETNGMYELELTYPVNSFLFEEVKGQRIIKAKANDRHDPQLFRIYNISKPISGRITVKAEHISYELKDNFIESLSYTGNCVSILNALNNNAAFKSRFNFNSDLIGNYTVMLERRNLLSAIMGQQGSLLQALGNNAKVERNNFDFNLKSNVGQDKNVLIAYRKNMTGFKLDEDWSKCITKIYPYATKQGENEEFNEDIIVTLSEKYIDSPYINNYHNPKILDVNFTDYFAEGEEITEASLRIKASNYFSKTKCDIPVLNYNIEFVALSKTEEYKHLAIIEDIGLFDTVIIRHETYDIDTKVQVIKYEYDSIAEEYLKQELGQPKITMSDVLGKINSSINNMNKNINDAKTELSNTINNVKTNTAENLNNAINNFDNALNKVTNDSSTALEQAKEELNNAITDSSNTNNLALKQAKEDLNNAILQYTGDKATTEALNLARTELANAINTVKEEMTAQLNNFINTTYTSDKASLKNQIDKKADTFYQNNMPHPNYLNVSDNVTYNNYVGDLWYDSTPNIKRSYIYTKTVDGVNFDYKWQEQEIPQGILDKIDGKSSIYAIKPSNYKKNDIWIVENDTVIPPYKSGDILTSIADNNTYNASDWSKSIRYIDNIVLDNAKNELNDNISTSINNAKNEMTNNIDNAKAELYKAVTNLDGSKASIEQLNLAKENLNNAINTATVDKATKDELTQAKNELLEAIDNAIKDIVTKSVMDNAIKQVSDAITGYDGGYVRLNPPSNPSEILVMDNEDINQAQTVWRWNKEGLGVSTTGYNGSYIGLTKNGKLVIDSTTTNTLDANFIKTQVIESINTNSKYFHLGSDAVILGDTATGNYSKVTANGIETYHANEQFEYLCCVYSEHFTLFMGCEKQIGYEQRPVTKKVAYSAKLKTLLRGRTPLQVKIMEKHIYSASESGMPDSAVRVYGISSVVSYDAEGVTIEGDAVWKNEIQASMGFSTTDYYTGGTVVMDLLVIA